MAKRGATEIPSVAMHTTLEEYIDYKINILEDDFYLRLTSEQKAHMRSLKSEIAVDNYAITLIYNR